jgi:hypothetical protein
MPKYYMRKFNLILGLVMLSVCSSAVMAEWNGFDGSKGPQAATLKAQGSEALFTVDLAIPGVDVTEKDGYSFVTIPGAAVRMIKDQPELPLVTTSILLPDRGTPEVILTVKEEVVIDLNSKIAPSKGHMTRDININEIARVEGEVYSQNALYPSSEYKYELATPYICRDMRGAALRICPVRYNPATNKMHVLKTATISVGIVPGATGINEKIRTASTVDSTFAPLYKRLFINYQSNSKNWTDINEAAGRAIIVCPDKYVGAMAPLQEWRATKGLDSKLVKVSDFVAEGTTLTAEALKAYLQTEYDAGGLTYVLLVGDNDLMPTLRGKNERAHADSCLVMLEGDDSIPDAFISRFSCNNVAELEVQVARTVKYESAPVTGDAAAFYRKATGIASNQGNPVDYTRCNWLRDIELAWNFDVVDQIYDPSANVAKVSAAINEGRSLINYIGHGGKDCWVSSRFYNRDVNALTNNAGKWPMIWSVACVNGDFAFGGDCFGEAWAKAGTAEDPRGAIGIVAASTNMAWVPPCIWQKAIIEDYMVTGLAITGGAQHHYGLLKACEEYGYESNKEGVQIVEQCIYFGDSSVTLRNDVPKQAVISVENTTDRSISIKVLANDKPVPGATIVIASELNGGMTSVTDATGIARVEFANGVSAIEAVSVTVTGHNLIPVINEAVSLR